MKTEMVTFKRLDGSEFDEGILMGNLSYYVRAIGQSDHCAHVLAYYRHRFAMEH